MDSFYRLEKILLLDNFSEFLLNFLESKVLITQQSNSEKWDGLFEAIEQWKQRYLISSEVIELFGVHGWYVDFVFNEFMYSTHSEEKIEEYVAIMILIDWIMLFYGDDDEYNCCKNSELTRTLQMEFDCPKEKCALLTKSQFFSELQDIYDHSYARFHYYKHTSKNNNPEVITTMEAQLSSYHKQIQYLRAKLKDCHIIRFNTFGGEVGVWYVIQSESAIYSIYIYEII